MRLFIIASLFSIGSIIGLSSVQWSPEKLSCGTELKDRLPAPIQDSVHQSEVRYIVEQNLVSRLVGQGGLESTWQSMDKSGHRNLIFLNADYDYKNARNDYVQMNDENEIFGDVVRLDGSFRSHICSFKIVYPGKEVFARRSVLDEWQNVVEFTGVKEATKMEMSGRDFREQVMLKNEPKILEPELMAPDTFAPEVEKPKPIYE
ncbi:MAG: hypothetical protein ACI837_002990 [Crocinitomicaceae bacterium]|jgi:hypothetical protein